MKNTNESVMASNTVKASNGIEMVYAYLSVNDGSYIAWTYGDCGEAFNTRSEAELSRILNFNGQYDSIEQMDEYVPVYKMIFINGVPDCKLVAIDYMSSRIKEIMLNRVKRIYDLANERTNMELRQMYDETILPFANKYGGLIDGLDEALEQCYISVITNGLGKSIDIDMKKQINDAIFELPIVDVAKEVSETELILSICDADFNVTIEEDGGYYTLNIKSSDGFEFEYDCKPSIDRTRYFDKWQLCCIVNEYIKWLQK